MSMGAEGMKIRPMSAPKYTISKRLGAMRNRKQYVGTQEGDYGQMINSDNANNLAINVDN